MPQRVTISRTISVALARSSAAPLDDNPNTGISAARPPSSTAIFCFSSGRVTR